MAISLGDAVVTFRADLTDLNKSIKTATGAMKKDFGALMDVSKQVGTAFTLMGGAIVGGLGLAVRESMAAEDSLAQLKAVVESTGGAAGMTVDELNSLAESLSKSTTFSDDAIVSGEALLLTFTNIGKEVFPLATTAMLDMSQAMGQDLKSSAVQIGKAINDPINGLTALTRVGVTFTDQQKEQIRTLQESGNVMGAQKIILAELAREFGGSAAAAAGTLSGQLTILKNDFGNLLEDIANALTGGGGFQGLIAQIRGVVSTMREWINAHPVLTSWIVKIGAAVGGLMFVLGPLLIALPSLVMAFTAIGPAAAAVGAAIAGISIPAIAIGAAIIALVVAAWYLYNNWDEVVAYLKDLWEDFKEYIAQTLQRLGGAIQDAMEYIVWAFNNPWDAVTQAWDAAKDYFYSWWQTIMGWFQAGWDFVAGIVAKIAGAIDWVGQQVGIGMADAAGGPPQFASGGTMQRSGMAIVGEQGPELVHLPAGARVYSNSESQKMMGGGGLNVQGPLVGSIQVSGVNDPRAVAEQIGTMLERAIQNKLAKRGLRLQHA